MTSGIKLLVGLGNPGDKYEATRHNAGFWWIDQLAASSNSKLALDAKFFGIAGKLAPTADIWLLKPTTFMNASGESVAPLARYYGVDAPDMIVIHDDLDLASGKLRLRQGGSSGGQNGIKSIMERLGSGDFARVKVGIGRPPGRMDPADYVLQNFSAAEEELFTPLRERVCEAVECWLAEGIETAMNRFNGALS